MNLTEYRDRSGHRLINTLSNHDRAPHIESISPLLEPPLIQPECLCHSVSLFALKVLFVFKATFFLLPCFYSIGEQRLHYFHTVIVLPGPLLPIFYLFHYRVVVSPPPLPLFFIFIHSPSLSFHPFSPVLLSSPVSLPLKSG